MRRISIGINWQGEFDMESVLRDARIADESGVHMLTIAEAWGRDAFSILAVIAHETRNIQLGTSIVNIFSRTPAALAQHFTTLDMLSGGRMMIGLGTSGPQVIEHFHGIPFTKPVLRMREYVDIINTLVAGEQLHYGGEFFRLERGFTLRDYENPVRRHIPIFIGAMGPLSIKQTAAIADGWLPGRTPREQWADQVEMFHGLVRDAGRDPADVEIDAPGGVRVTNDPEKGYDAIRRQTAFYMARMGDLHYRQFQSIGLGEEADAVRMAWRDGGSEAAFKALPDETIKQLGYCGPVEGCVEWMEAQKEAGYSIHDASVDEQDPKKRADIFRQLVG